VKLVVTARTVSVLLTRLSALFMYVQPTCRFLRATAVPAGTAESAY